MRLLCMDCAAEVTVDDEDTSVVACPECGSTSIPADLDQTVTVTLTAHELRILTMWADNYARTCDLRRVVRTICDRLATQTDLALTLGQEIADVRAAFPDSTVEIYDSSGRPVDL